MCHCALDADIDVPGSATIFNRNGRRVLAFGSKNGSIFLLNPDTMRVYGGWIINVLVVDQLSKATPALAVFDGQLHIVHLGNESNRIWHSIYDGDSWSENVPIPDQLSKASPAMAATEDELHLVHLGDSSNRIWHTWYFGLMQKRQLLPREGGTGHPHNRGLAIPSVAPISAPWYENQWGIYATPAIHTGLKRLFVGLGGRGAITDLDKTPFMRALDWYTLNDAWPTAVGSDNVSRYTTASPPLYT